MMAPSLTFSAANVQLQPSGENGAKYVPGTCLCKRSLPEGRDEVSLRPSDPEACRISASARRRFLLVSVSFSPSRHQHGHSHHRPCRLFTAAYSRNVFLTEDVTSQARRDFLAHLVTRRLPQLSARLRNSTSASSFLGVIVK